jgi:hypothetical protein
MQLKNTHTTLFCISIAKIATWKCNMLRYTYIVYLVINALQISRNINSISRLLQTKVGNKLKQFPISVRFTTSSAYVQKNII